MKKLYNNNLSTICLHPYTCTYTDNIGKKY